MGIVRLRGRGVVGLSTDARERADDPASTKPPGIGRQPDVDRRHRARAAQPFRPDARAPRRVGGHEMLVVS